MSLPAVLEATRQLGLRISRIRNTSCEAAEEAAGAARFAERNYRPFPLGLGLDIQTQPRFERWTADTYWYVQGNRFVSNAERVAILDAYFARQRERLAGGD